MNENLIDLELPYTDEPFTPMTEEEIERKISEDLEALERILNRGSY